MKQKPIVAGVYPSLQLDLSWQSPGAGLRSTPQVCGQVGVYPQSHPRLQLWLAPSKQLLAVHGEWAGVWSLRLFDLRGGQPKFVATLPQPNVYSVAFSPDSRYLAFGGAFLLKLFDLSAAQPKEVFSDPQGGALWVAFHPSGKWLVSAGGGRVCIRSVPDGKVVKEWTFPGDVGWAEFAHDGRHLFTHNANGTVYVLRLPDLEK